MDSTPGPRLVDLSLADFAERLAARTSTPGGGSLAAYLAACGAGAVSMAFRFTSGERFAAVEGSMVERSRELDALRSRALELVQEDTAAYDRVSAAFRLPKSNPEEKSARARAVQHAMRGALEVPLETMRVALAGLRLAAAGAAEINPNLASDCATGAIALAGGLEGALLNVRINAASLEDKALSAQRLAEAVQMRDEASKLLARARGATEKHLG